MYGYTKLRFNGHIPHFSHHTGKLSRVDSKNNGGVEMQFCIFKATQDTEPGVLCERIVLYRYVKLMLHGVCMFFMDRL